MTAGESDGDRPRPFPRHDLILIPLTILATLLLLAGVSELVARFLFRESATSTLSCLILTDPTTGVRARPGSHCRQKAFESPLVDYRFNMCGFRTSQGCGPKPPNHYRIVLIGSSLSFGMHVAQRDSFAARLGPLLSRRLGRQVEVYNEAMQWGLPASVALRTDAIAAAQPDMILWPVAGFDIVNADLILPYIPGVQQELHDKRGAAPIASAAPSERGLASLPGRIWRRIVRKLTDTRSIFMLRHYLYRSQSQILAHTLTQGSGIDYLRTPPSAALRRNLTVFAQALDRVAAQARALGVPLVITVLPSRTQSIMLADGAAPSGFDPNQLARLLRPIVEARHAHYVDISTQLARVPHFGQLYFSVDEHMPADGHQAIAEALANALVRDKQIAAVGRQAR